MQIAIHGLGKMGAQIARKLAGDGHTVIAHNRSPEPIEQAAEYGALAAYSKDEVLAAFGGSPVVLWIMLPDSVVESELAAWLDVLPADSLIIDGGNSDYRITQPRAQMVVDHGHRFVDVGTSGGIGGLDNGFCMMVGGDAADFEMLEPVLASLAAPHGGYQHFGPHGAGHFVKMVHNAIEYGMMESLAEGYRVLREGPYKQLDLGAAGHLWEQGSIIRSGLNAIAADVLTANPTLDGVDGYVAESGEARWTLETAHLHNIPAPAIQASLDVRRASQQGEVTFATKLLAELRHGFGGHAINKETK